MSEPTYGELIAMVEESIVGLKGLLINSPFGDTTDLHRLIRAQERVLAQLQVMRYINSPNPYEPLP